MFGRGAEDVGRPTRECGGIVGALRRAGPDVGTVRRCGRLHGERLLRFAAAMRPHLAIVDLCTYANEPVDPLGYALISDLRTASPATRVLVCAPPLDPLLLRRLLDLGIAGSIPAVASNAEWLTAVRTIARGKTYLAADAVAAAMAAPTLDAADEPIGRVAQLSRCEREVLQLIGLGHATRAIASILHKSSKTIETYRSRMVRKLRVNGATGLAQVAWQVAHPRGTRVA